MRPAGVAAFVGWHLWLVLRGLVLLALLALAVINIEDYQRVPYRRDCARLDFDALHSAGIGCWDLDRGLVGFDHQHRFAFGDRVAYGYQHVFDLHLVDTLARILQDQLLGHDQALASSVSRAASTIRGTPGR